MTNSTSYPTSWIDVARRDALWNTRPTATESIVFRAATVQQIQDALREEEYRWTPASIELAKEGVYDLNNPGSIFHPNNIKWIADAVGEFDAWDSEYDIGDPIVMPRGGVDGITYTVKNQFLRKALDVLSKNTNLLYVN